MVTVIIPTYKRAKYIDRAISSVLKQTYQDFEIIVVDDNDEESQDRKTMEKKMEKYKYNKKVIYLKHKKNQNGAAARNTGIKYAHGDYITFLDDDDFFISDRLEKLTNIMDKEREYDAIYTGVIICINKKINRVIPATKNGNLQRDLLMKNFEFGTGSNLFFRKEALLELKGFDETFIRHQDLEIMVRFFEKYKIYNLNEYLVIKCNDDRSNTINVDKLINVKEKYVNQFERYLSTKEEKQSFYKIQYLEVLYTAIKNKKYSAYKYVKQLLKEKGGISIKQNVKLFRLFILSFIDVRPIKELLIRKKLLKIIPRNIISETNQLFGTVNN